MHQIERAQVVVTRRWPFDASAAPGVRLIQSIGAGTDSYVRENIPPNAYLCNVYEHEESIAEHVFMTALALLRDLFEMDRELREGNWAKSAMGSDPPRRALRGLTLGVVGFGRIGKALVALANAFGMKVVATRGRSSHSPKPPGVSFLGGPEDKETVLAESDVIVVSTPLNRHTAGLIAARELSLMKTSAVLINVSRGAVVDEAALFEALRSRQIAGAAIDVWYQYPAGGEQQLPSRLPFHELDNVVMTPHSAGWTNDTVSRRWSEIAFNIDRIARNQTPNNVVFGPTPTR
ncbi:MAG: 2-hydroxyacid dehydrogenase [Trueperaceae bacterium]